MDVEVKTPEPMVEEPKPGVKAGKLTRAPKPVDVKLPSETNGEIASKEENLDLELNENEGVKSEIKEDSKPKKKQLHLF